MEPDVLRFAKAILHGDEEHRAWLLEAADAFCQDKPIPAVRGNGSKDQLRREIDELTDRIMQMAAENKRPS